MVSGERGRVWIVLWASSCLRDAEKGKARQQQQHNRNTTQLAQNSHFSKKRVGLEPMIISFSRKGSYQLSYLGSSAGWAESCIQVHVIILYWSTGLYIAYTCIIYIYQWMLNTSNQSINGSTEHTLSCIHYLDGPPFRGAWSHLVLYEWRPCPLAATESTAYPPCVTETQSIQPQGFL